MKNANIVNLNIRNFQSNKMNICKTAVVKISETGEILVRSKYFSFDVQIQFVNGIKELKDYEPPKKRRGPILKKITDKRLIRQRVRIIM